MKSIIVSIIFSLLSGLFVTAQTVHTSGDQSPAVIARDFQATYGVRADAVMAILQVYEKAGLSITDRKQRTEQLIREYSGSVGKAGGPVQLNTQDQDRLGISGESSVVSALEWDLFARHFYLSTHGASSPAVIANGNVSIWFGIPEGALRTLAARLEANAVELDEFSDRLTEMVTKYNDLKREMETYSDKDPIVRQAEALLEAGKLEDAEALLESDYHASKKRLAYKAFLFGKTEELLLKYKEAEKYYGEAVRLDSGNVEYLLAFGGMESMVLKYAIAMQILKKGIGLLARYGNEKDTLKPIYWERLGDIWMEKGIFDSAEVCFSRAFNLDSTLFGEMHPRTAQSFRKLGETHRRKGEFGRSLNYFLRALGIDSAHASGQPASLAEDHRGLASVYQDLGMKSSAGVHLDMAYGLALSESKSNDLQFAKLMAEIGALDSESMDFEKAADHYFQALTTHKTVFGDRHPRCTELQAKLGMVYSFLGRQSEALDLVRMAVRIDSSINGAYHPQVSSEVQMLAEIYWDLGIYDSVEVCLSLALKINDSLLGEQHPLTTSSMATYGRFLLDGKAISEGEQLCLKAFRVDSTLFGQFHPATGRDCRCVALAKKRRGDFQGALAYASRSIAVDNSVHEFAHLSVSLDYLLMSQIMHSLKDCGAARTYSLKSKEIMGKFLPPTHPFMICVGIEISNVLACEGSEFFHNKNFLEAEKKYSEASLLSHSIHDVLSEHTYLSLAAVQFGKLGNCDSVLSLSNRSIFLIDSLKAEIDRYRNESALVRPQYYYYLDDDDYLGLRSRAQLVRIKLLYQVGDTRLAKIEADQVLAGAQARNDEVVIRVIRRNGWDDTTKAVRLKN